MAIRNRMLQGFESLLRVPPLLVVDEIFRFSFGFGGKLIDLGGPSIIPGSSSSPPSSLTIPVGTKDNASISTVLNSIVDDVLNTSSSVLNNSSSLDDNLLSAADANARNSSGSSHAANWLTYYLPSFAQLWDGISKLGSTEDSAAVSHSNAENVIINEDASSYLFQVNVGDLSNIGDQVAGELTKVVEVLACLIIFGAAIVMFTLSTKNLIKLYSYLVSFLTLYLAYATNPIPLAWSMDTIFTFFVNVVFRIVLAGIFYVTRSCPGGLPALSDRPGIFIIFDSVLFSMFFVSGLVHFQPVIYLVLMLILQSSLWVSLPKAYNFLRTSWNETKRVQNEYGLSHLIQVESARLRINTVFRLFWMSRAAYDAFYRCCDEPVSHIFRYVMSHGTETFTGIIGLTVTVSAICHQIGECLLWILYYGTNPEADANRFGSISTVLFFILSLQTGLTSLDPEKRLDRLLKNIVLLGTALFHAIHQMVSPLLHAFRTFQALQIRAVAVSVFFLLFSLSSTIYLLRTSVTSTWSLAVLALAIEFKIKIVISLIISMVVYLSQLVQYPDLFQKMGYVFRRVMPNFIVRFFDNLYDQVSHEDMVFYLKSVANVAEFITGIFLFANAIWIFLFESASAIRAIGMSIHAYFNIWCEAQKGWKIYSQRKTAAQKIMSLADASEEQLQSRNDDVCAICYEEMESAKVTNCGHLFHAVCLRKWLYVQNTCPLCHEVLYGGDALDDEDYHNAGDEPPQQRPAPPPPNPAPAPSSSSQAEAERPPNAPPRPNRPRGALNGIRGNRGIGIGVTARSQRLRRSQNTGPRRQALPRTAPQPTLPMPILTLPALPDLDIYESDEEFSSASDLESISGATEDDFVTVERNISSSDGEEAEYNASNGELVVFL